MSGILEALEERLLQFLLEHETKKTWEDWLQWLDDLDSRLHLRNRTRYLIVHSVSKHGWRLVIGS